MWLQRKERPGNIIFNTFVTINGQTPDIKEKDGDSKSPLTASSAPPPLSFVLPLYLEPLTKASNDRSFFSYSKTIESLRRVW